MKPNYLLGVFIGRFQPFHLGHWHIMQQGLKHCDHLLILVGSANSPRTAKNPFTAKQRIQLIQNVLKELEPKNAHRVTCTPINDYPNDDQGWINNIEHIVEQALSSIDPPLPTTPLTSPRLPRTSKPEDDNGNSDSSYHSHGGQNPKNIALVSYEKDDSTYYLKYFPHWGQVHVDNYKNVNATDIRHAFYTAKSINDVKKIPHLPQATIDFLMDAYPAPY